MSFKCLTLRQTEADGLRSVLLDLLVLAALIFFALMNPAQAQQKRVLTSAALGDLTQSVNLAPHTLMLKDPLNKVTPSSIRASGGTILTGSMVDDNIIHLGFDGTPVWLTIKLTGNATSDDWVLDLGRRTEGRVGYLNSLRVYEAFVDQSGINLREIPDPSGDGAFDIKMAKGQEKLVLLNIAPATGRPSTLPLKIYSKDAFLEHVQSRSALNTFLCVSFAGLALFFLSYALTRRNNSYLLYCAHFALITAAWVLYNTVVASAGSDLFGILIPVCLFSFLIISTQITRVYLRIDQSHYTERYILHGLVWLNVSVFILGFILPISNAVTYAFLYYGAPLITLLVILLMAMAQSGRGQDSNPYYFLSWIPPVAGLIATMLVSFGVLPHSTFFMNAFWFMFLPHGVLLMLAVCKKDMSAWDNTSSGARPDEVLTLDRIKQTKENADHSRLLKVIEKERQMLGEFRAKEEVRVQEMEKAKIEADEANRAKSAFLAVVSHEIRTPMTGVMGMVRLLMDSSLTKQQRDYAMTIQESSEAMLGLLNDILDFEKIQRGKIELENISFDLHRLIQGVVTLMSGHAAQKNVGLSARMDDTLPRFVKGDPTRLRQVLLNLMGNGIKFTTSGSVTLLVKSMTPSEPEGRDLNKSYTPKHLIYFAVQDTGIGIPADAQKNLFNPFSQANSTITRKFGGTGLGLAISKGLVERMGSAININSREGEGSTFFFTLEMEPGMATQETVKPQIPADTGPVQPLKILVVDDNAITSMVAVSFLQQAKHIVTTAGTAENALEKINADNFDLIIMDIQLPGMPGNEATKKLREHANPAKAKIPVIAMTGNVDKDDMQRYLADGMNGFIAKPIDPDKLKSVVSEIAKNTYEREIKTLATPAYVPVPPPPSAPKDAAEDRIFDPEMLQSLKDTIGMEPLNDLLHDLVHKTDEILQAMIDASGAGDMDALAARAHELKGMAGNFGLVEISSIAAQTEKKAKLQELNGIDTLIAALPDANERAQSALKEWVSH